MKKPLVFRKAAGVIATVVVYLRGKKKPTEDLRSKAFNMAKKRAKGRLFKKGHLPYYDDEDGYQAALAAYNEENK